ncbi:MAG: selenocysteine-specific translation elongation factor [Gemmatimonadetes bacterium]|nr:selenocysteine-specific translation elongation factor [Gemmatimonadota bacterium]
MMRRLILGTAGHIDHGKTALVRALTGIDTDRLPEEKHRGITIDLGFAALPLGDDLQLGIVDVPGHEAFIRNMLAGATGIDLALLVVAADEGVMPQTREHMAIMELLGVRSAVVAVTKADLVEDDWLQLVLEDVRGQLAGTPFADAPLVPVSAVTRAGLDELLAQIAGAAARTHERTADDLFRLPIDRVFVVRGTGTVVTGTIWSGSVARDDAVTILPSGRPARVRGVQVHGVDVPRAVAGQRAAVALAGAERERLARGDTVVREAGWSPGSLLTARVRLLERTDWELRANQRVRFHLGTAEVMARVRLLDAARLDPGDEGWVQLRLEAPVAARAGDRFVLRSYSPVTTIGGGQIHEPTAPKRSRLEPSTAALLAPLASAADEAVVARVRLAGWSGVAVDRLPIETPLSPSAVAAALARLDGTAVQRIDSFVIDRRLATAARQALLHRADEYHAAHPLRPGIEREELRRARPPAAAGAVVAWALDGLIADGELVAHGAHVARRGFQPTLSPAQRALRDRLLTAFESAALTPPSIGELPEDVREHPDLRALLRLLEVDGKLVQLAPDMYISALSIQRAIAVARERLAGRGALAPTDFKEIFPVSRKYLIPLLEWFDRSGVTTRRGDLRSLRGI